MLKTKEIKMTVREENKAYHQDILKIMRQTGLIIAEEENQVSDYLWNSLEKGVN